MCSISPYSWIPCSVPFLLRSICPSAPSTSTMSCIGIPAEEPQPEQRTLSNGAIIGPPKVSLSGCGKCIHVNISLPEADPRSGIKDIMSFYYGVQFRVFWKKRNETAEQCFLTKSRNSTVTNLQIGTEYCVWVSTEININRNTKPSALECTFTGKEEPGRASGPAAGVCCRDYRAGD
uniref:Fibronectin type-III domain-containing protein n=1 Tax=Gasterosteus aculeatus aculeatus TaxID=481459 RepID=A0AAQ4PZ89_GASAC